MPPPVYARPAVVTGAVGGALGLALAVGCGVCAWQSDDVTRRADSSGDDKQAALHIGPWCTGGALAGLAITLVGAGVGVVGAVEP